jgi:tetratricopeptide (TPR) repeat protein
MAVRKAVNVAAGESTFAGATSASLSVLVNKVTIALSTVKVAASALTASLIVAGVVATGALATSLAGENTSIAAVNEPAAFVRSTTELRTSPDGGPAQSDRERKSNRLRSGQEPATDSRRREGPSASRSEPVDAALPAYQTLAKTTGQNASAHLRLALWCEARGLNSESLKHLALAILLDPSYSSARGLFGQVLYRGRWMRPDDVGRRIELDTSLTARLADYRARRAALENTADAHWKLALWCEENGLKEESIAHLSTVTRLDPSRKSAWLRLGYKEFNGHWLRPERAAAERAESEAQARANRRWRPALAKWKAALQDRNRRDLAERKLSNVTDPRAVPAIWFIFMRQAPTDPARTVRMLGQIQGPMASHCLALLAVFGETSEVRRAATETVARRDPREVIDLLINLLIKPIKYEVRPVKGPGSPGVLLVEGERAKVRRHYVVPSPPDRVVRILNDPTTTPPQFDAIEALLGDELTRVVLQGPSQPFNQNRIVRNNLILGEQNLMEAAKATLLAQRQMASDIETIEARNKVARTLNERVETPLRATTGQDFGQDDDVWRTWWTDQKGYVYTSQSSAEKPTIDETVALVYTPQYRTTRSSCFGAGTLVRTREGSRPIEAIRVGDVVLTQNPESGILNFSPVLAVAHNKPAPTLRIALDGEAIVATGIHRFWKVGRGWVMARELKTGDAIRCLGGTTHVRAISEEETQPVYNLEVGDDQSFFVGGLGALVHDNTLVQPLAHPFDQAPKLSLESR